MALGAAVATIFTIYSIVNSAGSAANISYEKEIVGESIKTMNSTVRQLQKRSVYTEKDKLDHKIKTRIVQKLSNTALSLTDDFVGNDTQNKKVLVHDVAKTTLMELAGRGVEEHLKTEVSKQAAKNFAKNIAVPVNIATGVVDAAIQAKSAWGTDSGLDSAYYKQLASPVENLNLDAQIAEIQAQKLVRDTQKVNAELRQMMIDFGIDPDNPEGSTDDNGSDKDDSSLDDSGSSDDSVSDDYSDDDWGDDYYDDDWEDYDDWEEGDVSSTGEVYTGDDYMDPYYGTDEWGEISTGLGYDDSGAVPDDYYGDDGSRDTDDYADDPFADDYYPPDPAAVDPGYYDDGGMVYPGTETVEFDDYSDSGTDTDDSGSGGYVDTEPCDPSKPLCGLDRAL